jgi:DNA-binding CsgD family transcriptional regulator
LGVARATEGDPRLVVLLAGETRPELEELVALASGITGCLPAGSPPGAIADAVNEVLVLLRQGYSTAEMARRLVVASVTVRTHVATLLHKLGLPNRDSLASASGGQHHRD